MTSIEVYNADAVDWLRQQESQTYDLIIADPPYNVGKDYGNTSDRTSILDQREFSREWLAEACRLLNNNGTIYVFMGVRHISYIYYLLEDVFGLKFNSWICWHYTQGLGRKKGFSSRHDDVLMFTKSDKPTFNLDAIRVPQKYYRSINNMRGANPGDVWEFSHIHYCQENRQDHPTQKPEGLIERMVRASSNLGDRVLDPFSGSGTTLRVCQQLGRNCDGVELNAAYVEASKARLAAPFSGFDSIDPKMKRVPLDLRDNDLRERYIKDHIDWFLDHHESDMDDFLKEVERVYPSGAAATKRRGRKKAVDVPSLFKTP